MPIPYGQNVFPYALMPIPYGQNVFPYALMQIPYGQNSFPLRLKQNRIEKIEINMAEVVCNFANVVGNSR